MPDKPASLEYLKSFKNLANRTIHEWKNQMDEERLVKSFQ